jgi:hypothetical protein
VLVSSTCLACFLFRSVAVPFIDNYFEGKYGWLGLWLIFNLSEVIPMLLMLYIFEGRGQESSAEVAPAPYTKLSGAPPPIPATRLGAPSTTNNGLLGIHVQSPQAPPYMPYAPPVLGQNTSGHSTRHGVGSSGSRGARDSPRGTAAGNGYGSGVFGTPPTPPFSVERGSRFDRFDRDRYDEHNRDLFALD